MSLSDKLSELADYAVHAGLVAWFFFYFLVKGEKSDESADVVHPIDSKAAAKVEPKTVEKPPVSKPAVIAKPLKVAQLHTEEKKSSPTVVSSPPSAPYVSVDHLKHSREPQYPAALTGDFVASGSFQQSEVQTSRTTVIVRQPGVIDSSIPHPPPPPPIVGQTTVQIQVKPPLKANLRQGDTAAEIIWPPRDTSKAESPQSPGWAQRDAQKSQLLRTRDRSTSQSRRYEEIQSGAVAYDDLIKPVGEIKKTWPPPSNAFGVEIVKDINFDGSTQQPNLPTKSEWKAPETSTFTPLIAESSTAEDVSEATHLPKAVRNPAGELQDYQKLANEYGSLSAGMMSPERCYELSQLLQMAESTGQSSRGVELFARRREKSDNWVVDESNVQKTAGPMATPQPAPRATLPQPTPPQPIVQSEPDKQESVLEQWRRTGGITMVKSPWEAALEDPSGNPSSAFVKVSELVDTVKAAADRKGRLFSPPTPYYQDSYESRVSRNLFSPPREVNLPRLGDTRLFTPTPFSPPPPQIFTPPPVAVERGGEEEKFFVPLGAHRPINFTSDRPTFATPKAESRLFTPQPFSPSPAPLDSTQIQPDRSQTPTRHFSRERIDQFGVREASQPRGWQSQYGEPIGTEADGSVVRSSRSRITKTTVTTGSSSNTLPKSWKSFADSYKQNYE